MTRNVVLICLDSVRKDYFDEYATRLQSMADASYEQCRAVSGWSVPSHASMFTGELPSDHGIDVYNRDFSGLDRADTFLGDLPHRAFGVSANAYASSAFGFDGIFDAYTDISPHRRFPEGLDVMRFGQTHDLDGLAKYREFVGRALRHDHPLQSLANGVFVQVDDVLTEAPVPKVFDDGARIITRQARDDVAGTEEPFLLFMNYMDAHGPFAHVRGYDRSLHDVPNAWNSGAYRSHEVNVADDRSEYEQDIEYTRQLYGASVDYLDRVVSEFVEWVQSTTDGPTTFVVTADHGENLAYDADHGLVAHKGAMTEGLLHVPLCVIDPPESVPGGTVDEYVSHLALGDLVTSLAADEHRDVTADRIPAERVGSNLPSDVSRRSEEGRHWDRMIRCVYDGDRKYQWDSEGGRTAYRLDADRPCWQEPVDESFDVDDLESAHFREPIEQAKETALAGSDAIEVDEATKRRLEELGYR